MPTQRDVRQRQSRAARAAEARRAAETRRARRKRWLVGGLAGLLVAVLLIPLGAGLLPGGGDGPPEDVVVGAPESEATEPEPPEPETPQSEATGIEPAETTATDRFEYGEGDCPAPDGSSEPVLKFDGPPPLCINPDRSYAAVFDTSEGTVRFELDAARTPGTVNNFVTLARWGYYDDTLLFRTDPSIDIIQGGSPTANSPGDPGPGYTIRDEPPLSIDPDTRQLVGPYRYEPGQIVMARGPGPDSAGAQFFFTTGPNAALLDNQGVYVVFGTTDEAGLEVLQSIIALHVDREGGLGGEPSRPVAVWSVTIEEN